MFILNKIQTLCFDPRDWPWQWFSITTCHRWCSSSAVWLLATFLATLYFWTLTCLFEGIHWWRGYFSSTARMPFDCLHFAILQKDAKGPICKWCQKIYKYLETKSPVGVSHAKTPNADAQSEGWKWHGQASWLSVFEKCCFVWIKKSRNCSSKPPQHILLYFLESQIGIFFMNLCDVFNEIYFLRCCNVCFPPKPQTNVVHFLGIRQAGKTPNSCATGLPPPIQPWAGWYLLAWGPSASLCETFL